jgi:ABC-type lipoprotein export system ATPase subunit
MGRSGSGKTTLIKTLGLIDAPTKGTVFFEERDTTELYPDELADIRRREMGFIFQDYYLMNSLSVRENIMLPMVLDKAEADTTIKKAEQLAGQFGLLPLLEKNPYELSGGEMQRTAICRALMNDPKLILADEPTGNLDSVSGKIVIDEFRKINVELGKTIVMVTHDPQMASYCKRILFLKDGVILEDLERQGNREEFYLEVVGRMKKL